MGNDHRFNQTTGMMGRSPDVARAESTPGKSTLTERLAEVPEPRLDGNATVHAIVVGHASPRWRQPKASTKARRNLALSAERAQVVQVELESLLGADSVVRNEVDDRELSFETISRGSADTTVEAMGDSEADAARYRRVDITVEVDRDEHGVAHQSTSDKVNDLIYTPSRDWMVEPIDGGGAHLACFGKYTLYSRLTNRKNCATAECRFDGWGPHIGFDCLFGVDIDIEFPGGGTDFTTRKPVTFDDFSSIPAELSDAGASAGIGVSGTILDFPIALPIFMAGLNLGLPGVGAKILTGEWKITQMPKQAGCMVGRTRIVPTVTTRRQKLVHSVHFDLEKSVLSPTERELLASFTDRVVEATR